MQVTQRPSSHSQTLLERAQQRIPGGVNSPVRAFKSVGGTPIFIKNAQGPYLYDVDNNQYIDYVGSWGPMIHGHAHPAIIEAITTVAQYGSSFGAPCELEIKLAEMICQHMPSIEQIRMVNSGTEATMSALRLARAATSRSKFVKFDGCYHGHADSFLVNAGSGALTLGTPSSPGVTPGTAADTLTAPFNDLEAVNALFQANPSEIAAVIIEPITGNMGMIKAQPEFLIGLRALCDQHGALLIFDEVMTGFRVALGGAQSLYSVQPDLTTLGKVIGGGLPVGAYGGRADLMQLIAPAGPVYQAGTLSGNPLAMAAGCATLERLNASTFEQLDYITNKLTTGMKQSAEASKIPLSTEAQGGMFGFFFSDTVVKNLNDVQNSNLSLFKQFHAAMLEAGIYWPPSPYEANFLSMTHDEGIIEKTLFEINKVFNQLN